MASAADPATSRRTFCCHCEARCGVIVELDGEGLPSSIRGDRSDPVSRGFICVRGQAAIEYFADESRLNVPLRRSGPRGSGDFVEVSWEEAVDDIGERLLAIAASDGPEAVAQLHGRQFGSDSKFGNRLMHLFGSPNVGGVGLMCGGPQFVAGALTFGWGSAFPEVIPGVTDAIVIWGQHPSASAPPYWGVIREATRAGAKLVVVDARPTLEARAADIWLQPRPATDAALALALLNVTIAERLWDEEFVERWTFGFADLRQRIERFTPEWAAAITGVAVEPIRDVARIYSQASASALSPGTPNGQGRNALNLERSLCILLAINGKLDREGCNRLFGPTRSVGNEVAHDAYESLPPAVRARRLGSDRFRLHGEGTEILNRAASRAWHNIPFPITRAVLGVAHPLAIFDAIETGEPYPVKALLVQHHNPIGAYNGTARVRRALASSRLELLVVHELRLTATAMLADYVLPAASWMEKPFLLSPGWAAPIVAGDQVVPPLYDRRSDYDLCRDLGRRLGQDWPDSVEDVFDDWLQESGLTYQALLDGERVLPGSQSRGRFQDIDPLTGKPYGFGTPSQRIELRSTVLEQLDYDPLPSFDETGIDPDPAFPLWLMTGATRIDATHQDHRHVESLRRRHPDPVVEIDPETANQLGASEGDWLRITTSAGEILQRATLLPGLGTDRVSAERWWYPEQSGTSPVLFNVFTSNVNAHTSSDLADCDPAYGGLPYRNAHCRIELA